MPEECCSNAGPLIHLYEGLLKLEQTKESILDLFEKSSLFITKAIVSQVIEELERRVRS